MNKTVLFSETGTKPSDFDSDFQRSKREKKIFRKIVLSNDKRGRQTINCN